MVNDTELETDILIIAAHTHTNCTAPVLNAPIYAKNNNNNINKYHTTYAKETASPEIIFDQFWEDGKYSTVTTNNARMESQNARNAFNSFSERRSASFRIKCPLRPRAEPLEIHFTQRCRAQCKWKRGRRGGVFELKQCVCLFVLINSPYCRGASRCNRAKYINSFSDTYFMSTGGCWTGSRARRCVRPTIVAT